MKLLLDQGLPRSAAALLSDVGIDTIHVGEIGLSAAEDADILQRAREEERVVVTLDADFHTLLALNQATSPSVIRIRIESFSVDYDERVLFYFTEDGNAVFVDIGSHDEVY